MLNPPLQSRALEGSLAEDYTAYLLYVGRAEGLGEGGGGSEIAFGDVCEDALYLENLRGVGGEKRSDEWMTVC